MAIKKKSAEETNKAARETKLDIPFKELDQWLKGRSGWNHNEWSELLTDLSRKGYSQITNTESGRNAIGKYLEEHKK